MATEFWVRDATNWRKAKEIWVRDATDWRKAKEVWVRDATDWRKVYQGFSVVAEGADYSGYTNYTYDTEFPELNDLSGRCRLIMKTDGSGVFESWVRGPAIYGGVWALTGSVSKPWGDPTQAGIGPAYKVRIRMQTGSITAGYGNNIFYTINTDIYWDWEGYLAGGTFYIDISADGGSTWVTSALSSAYVYYVEWTP